MMLFAAWIFAQLLCPLAHGSLTEETLSLMQRKQYDRGQRTSSLRSVTGSSLSQSRRLGDNGRDPVADVSDAEPIVMAHVDRQLEEEFPTRAPHFNFWYLSFPPDESPTRAPIVSQALESAEEEVSVHTPMISPVEEMMPTKAPSAASLSLQSSEEPLVPTRAPEFAVVDEQVPTRAPLRVGQPLRADEETVTPTVSPPTAAPTFRMGMPIISRFTNRPTNVPTLAPCYVCGSMTAEITKPEEIVATESTLLGSCFDVASRGTFGGFNNCDEVQLLVAQVCGCETVISASTDGASPTDPPATLPPFTPSPSSAGEEPRDTGDNGVLAGSPSSSCPRRGGPMVLATLGALLLGIAWI